MCVGMSTSTDSDMIIRQEDDNTKDDISKNKKYRFAKVHARFLLFSILKSGKSKLHPFFLFSFSGRPYFSGSSGCIFQGRYSEASYIQES